MSDIRISEASKTCIENLQNLLNPKGPISTPLTATDVVSRSLLFFEVAHATPRDRNHDIVVRSDRLGQQFRWATYVRRIDEDDEDLHPYVLALTRNDETRISRLIERGLASSPDSLIRDSLAFYLGACKPSAEGWDIELPLSKEALACLLASLLPER